MTAYLRKSCLLVTAVIGFMILGGCSTAPKSEEGKVTIETDADMAIAKAKESDPAITNVLNTAAGYAVFPKVGKGGVGVGGAYGKGVLYEGGKAIGYCDLSQATIGLQLGGQTYTEIICFETKTAVEDFKAGKFEFDAQATAVALKKGAAANAKYSKGVLIFTVDPEGLMAEASVGGQKFKYQAK